jgi:hypothetical protein
MTSNCIEQHGLRILEVAAEGAVLSTDRDAVTLIGDALGCHATMVLLPVSRLDDAFFDLSTRIAGEIVQKFVNYGVRLVIVGDISRRLAESKSLRDFVYEANRGDRIWFVNSTAELDSRLRSNKHF